MNDNTSFHNLVNTNPVLAERMATVTAEVIRSTKELFGVTLELDEVASLTAVRASVLGDMPLDDFLQELATHPKVKARTDSLTKAQPKPKPKGEAAPLNSYREALAEFTAARAGNAKPPAESKVDPANLSDVEKLRHLQSLPPGDKRKIDLARRWGLVPAAKSGGY